MPAPKMKTIPALSGPLKRRAARIVPLAALLLAVPFSASALAAPTVNVTAYSQTITGNIGSATNGVKATVSLTRGPT